MKGLKKALCIVASLLMLTAAFSFVGCDKRTKLRVINYRPEDQKYYNWLIEEFNKENPDVNVVYEAVDTSGYSNLLNSRLKANAVDVFGAEAAYVGSEPMQPYMEPLNGLKAPDGASLWDTIDDGSKTESKLGENYLVAPLSRVTMLVYYNKDVMNETNLGFSFANGKYPTTWSEFEKTMLKLKGLSKDVCDGVFVYGGQDGWPMSMIISAVEVNTVRSVEPDFYLKMAQQLSGYDFGHTVYRDFFGKLKEVCSYVDSNMKGSPYNRAPARFGVGKYAMMIDGSWSYTQIKLANLNANLGFFPLPVNSDAEKNVSVPYKTATGFAINSKSPQKELAQKFIEFMYRGDVYQKYIDAVCGAAAVKGVELTDKTANEMFDFEMVLTSENMWIPGMEGVERFRTIGNNMVGGGGLSVDGAVGEMNDSLERTREKWTAADSLEKWFSRFYPDAERPY